MNEQMNEQTITVTPEIRQAMLQLLSLLMTTPRMQSVADAVKVNDQIAEVVRALKDEISKKSC